jgi:hypothetical protein
MTGLIEEKELQKVINKTESSIAFEDLSVMNRANSLAFYELLGNADLMNIELQRYQEITAAGIRQYAQQIFETTNSNTLYYFAQEKSTGEGSLVNRDTIPAGFTR